MSGSDVPPCSPQQYPPVRGIGDDCPICHEVLTLMGKPQQLCFRCGHSAHEKCILDAQAADHKSVSSQCPLCREPLRMAKKNLNPEDLEDPEDPEDLEDPEDPEDMPPLPAYYVQMQMVHHERAAAKMYNAVRSFEESVADNFTAATDGIEGFRMETDSEGRPVVVVPRPGREESAGYLLHVTKSNFNLTADDQANLCKDYPQLLDPACHAVTEDGSACDYVGLMCPHHGHQVVGDTPDVVFDGPNVDLIELVMLLCVRFAGEGRHKSVANFISRARETNRIRAVRAAATDRLNTRGCVDDDDIYNLPNDDPDRVDWLDARSKLTGRLPNDGLAYYKYLPGQPIQELVGSLGWCGRELLDNPYFGGN